MAHWLTSSSAAAVAAAAVAAAVAAADLSIEFFLKKPTCKNWVSRVDIYIITLENINDLKMHNNMAIPFFT